MDVQSQVYPTSAGSKIQRKITTVKWVVVCLTISACCHINRLNATGHAENVELIIECEPSVHLLFTRKMGRQTQRLIGALARSDRSILNYQETIQWLTGAALQRRLKTQLRQELEQSLGWKISSGKIFRVVIEEVIFTAKDQLAPVSTTWTVNANLTDSHGDLIWRTCARWNIDLGSGNMQQFAQMDKQGQLARLEDMVQRVSKHLVHEIVIDKGDIKREGP